PTARLRGWLGARRPGACTRRSHAYPADGDGRPARRRSKVSPRFAPARAILELRRERHLGEHLGRTAAEGAVFAAPGSGPGLPAVGLWTRVQRFARAR